MSSENHDGVRTNFWSLQPYWVRVITTLVAVPAWIGMAYLILTRNLNTTYIKLFLAAMVVVAIIQVSFLARAYWRNET